jgi:hypothetical protein
MLGLVLIRKFGIRHGYAITLVWILRRAPWCGKANRAAKKREEFAGGAAPNGLSPVVGSWF